VEFAAVLDVRRLVFGEEQGLVVGDVADRDDWRSLHALAYLPGQGERGVGTGRLTLAFGDGGEAMISWLATLPAARRLGVGSAVMRFLLATADASAAPRVVLAAQLHAEPFYRQLGFVATGNPYVVRGVLHRRMVRVRP
jgi:predicted GNAT family N-acyltransferase